MGKGSKIQWTHHTFNPWRGCTKVSAGCANCYAETLSKRNPKTLGVWGPRGSRVVAADAAWRDVLRWDIAATLGVCVECGTPPTDHGDCDCGQIGAIGKVERARVFCASLADVFERPETMPADSVATVRAARLRLFRAIQATPRLDWLLLTKRPETVLQCLEEAALDCSRNDATCEMLNAWIRGTPPGNVWLGASVEDQAAADSRIRQLCNVPAVIHFLSIEPLLEPIVFDAFTIWDDHVGARMIDWVIIGGESGGGARACRTDWIRQIINQCKITGSADDPAVFVKQLGADPVGNYYTDRRHYEDYLGRQWPDPIGWRMGDGQPPLASTVALPLVDRKGGEIAEFPPDLQIREIPTPRGGRR